MNNHVYIPHIPVLDAIDVYSNSIIMETQSKRLPVMTANWPEEFPYTPITTVDLAYSDKGLYVRFFTKGKGLKCQVLKDGGPVYKDSCVEFFIQKPDDDHYYNFEFNCCGICDASYRTDRENAIPFVEEQYERIHRSSTERLREINDGTTVHEYSVSIMIPFALLGYSSINDLPDHFMVNFYKCGDETAIPHFASWAPITTPKPDFHRPEFFQPIYLSRR